VVLGENIEDQYIDSMPFTFCFVRNPFSWYESWWKYMSNRDWNKWGKSNSFMEWHPNSVLNGLGSPDFNKFVVNVLSRRPGYVSELYGSFANSSVNFIGKNENLCEDLITVLNHLNLRFNEDAIRNQEKINVSTSTKKLNWSDQTISLINKYESVALSHYGYEEESLENLTLKHKSLQKINYDK